jgi:Tol biopolymer transport system component
LDWPSDGRFLVYVEAAPETAADLWLLPMIGEKKPVSYLRTPFSETDAKVSPDGRWLAYVSNESGNNEIYVGSFPARERSWRVSTGGGSSPRWSGNARELFFVDPANQLMVVPIETRDGYKAGTPRALFPAGSREGANTVISYAVSPDGPGVYTTPITVVLDWTADLKRPTGEGKN